MCREELNVRELTVLGRQKESLANVYFLNNFFYPGAFEGLTPYTVGRARGFETDQ